MSTERDTHFQGFAKLLMPELDSLFILLYQAYAMGDMAKRDEYSQRIQTLLAERGYDLVSHSLEYSQDDVYWPPQELIKEYVPDMTAWPEGDRLL